MPTNYMRDRLHRNQMLMPWVPSETISTVDAAAMMQSCVESVRALLEEGKIKGYRMRPDKPHSPWRVSRKSVELYISAVKEEYALDNSAGVADGPGAAGPARRTGR